MIATIRPPRRKIQTPTWHATFLAMLPTIRQHACIVFRAAPPDVRQELIQEVVANSFVAYARLIELGKENLANPCGLSRFAVAQVRTGRRVGSRLRIRDVMSQYAQHHKGFHVDRLDYFDRAEGTWEEVLVEDKRATPAQIAACRIDFANWLGRLPRRLRKIALTLAGGETTSKTAKKFGVTAARISQLRLWLKESWELFQGEGNASKKPRLAVAA